MRKNIGFLKNDKKYWNKNLEKLEKRENQKNAKTNFSKNAGQTYTNL